MQEPLRRSKYNRVIGGVLGGIAEYYDLKPNAVRIGYVLLSILSAAFPGTIVYLILWLMIPSEDADESW